MLVINSIEKTRLSADSFSYSGSAVAWKARLVLFLGFALMAGGLAGSVTVMVLKYLVRDENEGESASFMTLWLGIANVVANALVMLRYVLLLNISIGVLTCALARLCFGFHRTWRMIILITWHCDGGAARKRPPVSSLNEKKKSSHPGGVHGAGVFSQGIVPCTCSLLIALLSCTRRYEMSSPLLPLSRAYVGSISDAPVGDVISSSPPVGDRCN